MKAWTAPRYGLWVIQALSLGALIVSSYGWIQCPRSGVCSTAKDALEFLGYAFPNGIIWFLMFATPNYELALGGTILLNLGLALAIWRWAPARLRGGQVMVFVLAWLALWALTLWFFPYFAGWGWGLAHPR